MIIGAQGYTIREFAQDEAGIAESLAKISKIGYKAFQLSAFGPIDRAKLKEMADANGLSIVLTHTPPDRITGDTAAVIAEHEIMGCKYVGIGAMPPQYRTGIEGARAFLKDYDAAAKQLASKGMKLFYHNHGFEFARHESKPWLNWMMEETSPDEWGFTLDVFWLAYSGMNPVKAIKEFAGRLACCHLKDMVIANVDGDSEQRMAAVGEGNLDWEAILPACEAAGVEYALVEQDRAYGRDPFDELRISYENLKKAGMRF